MARRSVLLAVWFVALLLALTGAGFAQSQAEGTTGLPEAFEIGLSTEEIVISSDFSGARLVVFGALDNADAKVLRQGGYDIVVALEGPVVPIVVREKERTVGLWINQGSERFDTVPASYSLAATRRLTDITSPQVLSQLSIGIDHLQMSRRAAGRTSAPNRDRYATAVRRIRSERGLFRESFGTVEFVSATLFRAELRLPADLPVGKHVARAFLFRKGVFLRERTDTLWVVKSGFESTVSDLAHRYGPWYGSFAVALAIVTGWLGRLIFRRD
ncbi:TIGR02186 family protein [Aureimonas leprariae]|uniref:TIGR02186 family protein n=1 Tax=Plantimonas leprariae TaxID=2615207 RepID=UPI001FEC26F4|nr:TIGR02186 family protein [Aureimonas leprariae]